MHTTTNYRAKKKTRNQKNPTVKRERSPSVVKHSTAGQRVVAYLIMSLYVILFVVLVIAALLTQNFFLLTSIPLMAKALANTFCRVIDFLLTG